MTTAPRNPLAESGKPLFFRVETANRADSPPPVPHLGDALRVRARSLSVMQKEALAVAVS